MDKLDKFNNTVLDLCLDWKNIFYFVAGIYILSTILFIGEGSRWGLAIISWAILFLVAVIMRIVLKADIKSSKRAEKSINDQSPPTPL
jgi:hypothetical protein